MARGEFIACEAAGDFARGEQHDFVGKRGDFVGVVRDEHA